jgi:hypothetical protein
MLTNCGPLQKWSDDTGPAENNPWSDGPAPGPAPGPAFWGRDKRYAVVAADCTLNS